MTPARRRPTDSSTTATSSTRTEAGCAAHYVLGERRFCEEVTLGATPNWGSPGHRGRRPPGVPPGRHLRYFKTAAPGVVDLGATATTALERAFLRRFYTEGLAEFAYRNGLDLGRLEVSGPDADPPDHDLPDHDPAAVAPLVGQGRRSSRSAGDRLHRLGRVGAPPLRRRLPLRHQPGRRSLRRHRGRRRGHRAPDRAGRTADRSPSAGLGRARLLERSRPGDRHPLGHRRPGGGPLRPRRRRHVQRVVGLVRDGHARRTGRQPPVLQERRLRRGLRAGPGPALRDRSLLLLAAPPLLRALGGQCFALSPYHRVFRSCNRASRSTPPPGSTTGAGGATSAASST